MTQPIDKAGLVARRCENCRQFGSATYGNAGWCSLLHQWQERQDVCEDWIAAEADDDSTQSNDD